MRKKVFSALLFGTLAVVSTGSLVSCKDYDDDITNLQNQINELNTLVKTIQGQIEKGAILTAVTPTANGVTVELSNGKTYDITNGQKGDAGVDGTVWKIGDNGNWWSSTAGAAFVDTGMAAQGAKGDKGDTGAAGAAGAAGATGATGAAGKDGKYYVPNEQTGTFWVYNDGDKAAYDSKISYVAAATVSAVWEKDKLTINNVEGATDKKVVINLTTELKSLVFSPDFYYGGIEALDVASFKYKPLKLDKVDANADNAADAPTAAADFFTYAPELNATYFLNPSNAKIDVEKLDNYKFIPYDKKYYSRAIESTDFTVTKAEKKDGQVTVYASYKGEEIKKLTDNQVTVIALQYKGDDNVVTSDFAALRNTNWEKLALNNPKGGVNSHVAGDDHLYTTAAAAIAAAATVEVGWDKTIDLREYVNTDRVEEGSTECKAWDKNAAAGTVDKIGFKYVFELVGYKAGDNDTKQSVHAAIADDGYTLRPQMPKDGVQQAYGAEQSKATIDKEPLVRVSLVDTKNKNQVVAVGYMKLKIVLTPVADVKPEALDMGAQTKAYTLTCGTAAYLTQKLNWHEVEEKIIAKINVSKADFHNNYVLKGATVNATGDEFVDADQFSSTDGTAIGTKIGVVSQTKTDENGTETEVLTWTVANNEAYSAFKAGKKELSTLVCYENKNNAKDRVYLKFSWKPEAINIKPETSFSNDNKIKSYWYAANDPVAGTGWNEIHGNVEVVGTSNNGVNGATTAVADDEFVFNIKNTLVGNKLTVAKFAAPYQGLDTKVTTSFEFVNGHGLYANATGDKLYADALLTSTKLVATLDKVKGVVKLNADEATNKEAKKLLNAYGHTTKAELEKSLTARVKVVAKVCSDINVPVSTNEFDVKFIRPISVTSASATFTDAAGTEKELSLTFKDWRNMGFTDASRVPSTVDFFAYYGVSAIALDTDNATTDLNGNAADKLKVVAPKIKLDYEAPTVATGSHIVADAYGKIKYENLGNTVGTFHIVIPGTVTYHWGKLPIKVLVTVNGTVSAKRH